MGQKEGSRGARSRTHGMCVTVFSPGFTGTLKGLKELS